VCFGTDEISEEKETSFLWALPLFRESLLFIDQPNLPDL
jgi:hypothetical protein